MVTRDVFQVHFENLKNITRAHISRNALAFIRFPILTYMLRVRDIERHIEVTTDILEENNDNPSNSRFQSMEVYRS